MKVYQCSLDKLARIMPMVLVILALSIAIPILYADITGSGPANLFIAFSGPGIILVLCLAMYRLKIRSITVDDQSITIDRKVKPVTIRFSDITAIRKVDDMKFAIRTFGNGGLFGYTGLFYKKGTGSMTWYCTQRTNYVLIQKTNGNKIVITPDNSDGFVRDIALAHPFLVAIPGEQQHA